MKECLCVGVCACVCVYVRTYVRMNAMQCMYICMYTDSYWLLQLFSYWCLCGAAPCFFLQLPAHACACKCFALVLFLFLSLLAVSYFVRNCLWEARTEGLKRRPRQHRLEVDVADGSLSCKMMDAYIYTHMHCIALHCIALHCIALHCTALHCIALH